MATLCVLPAVYRHIDEAKTFHENLSKKYPQARKPLTVVTRRNKVLTFGSGVQKPTAFYVCDVHNKLTPYDEDGTKMGSRTLERTPEQCIILSNGCVVQSYAGAHLLHKNLVISTLLDGESQVISLPEEEDSKEYTLLEYPKNFVCIYRKDHLFMFDPMNPFTTHRRIPVDSTSFQQFQGNLYLWSFHTNRWKKITRDGQIKEFDILLKIHEPKYISDHQFVVMDSTDQIGVYCTKADRFDALKLKPYVNGKVGRCQFMSFKNYILVAQWPSWAEQSFDVRLTVFCVSGMDVTVVYENLTWFDNKSVGMALMNDMIGGFAWPYLQKYIPTTSVISIDNLETNTNIGSFKCSFPVKCQFVGDHLAIVTNPVNSNISLIPFQDTHRVDLTFRFGRVFMNAFDDAKLSIVVTPDPRPDIQVNKTESDVKPQENACDTKVEAEKTDVKVDVAIPIVNAALPTPAPVITSESTCTIC